MVEHKNEMGPFGRCICPNGDHRTPHHRGVPCQEERCPSCGAKLLREGSEHHRLFEEKHRKGRSEVEPSD